MHFSCLSNEIIEIILSYNDISFEDIINFRCVCKRFSQAARDEYCFLKKKYSQRWPVAKEHFDKHFKKNESEKSKKNEKWLKFIKIGTSCARQLRDVVSQIIHSNNYHFITMDELIYNHDHITDHTRFLHYLLDDLKEIINETDDYIILIFFTDEIKNLLTQSHGRTSCDLTQRYYYIMLYKYLRSYLWQENNFDKFQEHYHKEHFLERTATVVTNWLQPDKNVLYSSIKTSLDSIALEVLNCLKKVNPNHSIFSKTDKTFTDWKNNKNIEDNYWNETEGTEIINTLEKYIFGDKFKFLLDSSDDYMYTCIDYILENEKSDEMNLLIIYQSVARRLGLRCEIVKLPGDDNLQLFWKPKYTDDIKNIRLFEIVITYYFESWRLSYELLNFQPLDHSSIVYSKIIRKEAYILEPKEMLEALQYFPNVLSRFVDHQYILHKLKFLACKSRPQEVKFAVGMIVKLRDYSSDSDGVIIGWHQFTGEHDCDDCDVHDDCFITRLLYSGELEELSFWHCFSVHNDGKCPTTLYIILHDNIKISYVKEDDITLTTEFIDEYIDDAGFYFCKFEKTHYVPNKLLEEIYPQDAAIAARTVNKN